MTPIIGRTTQIYIGKETTFGTKASSFIALPVRDFNFNPQQEFAKDNSVIGRIEENVSSIVTKQWSEPTFGGLVLDKAFGHLLLMALGVVSTTADSPEAGVNTHAFSVKNDNNPISYTIIFKDAVQTKMVTGAVLNTLETSSEDLADYVTYTASFFGKFPTTTTQTETYVAENIFAPKFTTIKLASALSGLDAAAAISLEAAKLTIEKNVEAEYSIGNVEPTAIFNKQFNVFADMTALFEDETYYDIFEAGTKKAVRFELENTDVTIGAATNPKVTIDLAKCSLEDFGKEAGADEKVVQTFALRGEYSLTDGKAIQASLINTQTSY